MTSTRPVSEPTSGPIVGGYRLLARIGEGGMGVVHVAEGRDGRRVALKVLRPHVVGDDEARRRLAREVASLRQVHSRHVAEVLDADPWGETPYIVTRFVPGHSLHETVLRDGPLPVADLLHLGRRLLDAVRDVHAADVLHRDLKPTNVVMEGRSPILIDFGLARLAEDPRLTVAGFLLGTPGYLAPEMLFGDPATAATDVHGWAATVAYAATGRSPYGAGHTMAVLDRTRRGQVDLAGVPDRLRPLLEECLALEPLDRPSVHELSRSLSRFEDDRPAVWEGGEARSPSAPAAAPPTMPWPLVAPENPETEVIAQSSSHRDAGTTVPDDDAPTVVQPAVEPGGDAPTVVQPAAGPAPGPPTRRYPAVAPAAAPPPAPQPVGGPPPTSIAPTPPAGRWPPRPSQHPGHPAQHPGGPVAGGRPAGASPYPPAQPVPARPADRPLTAGGRLRRGTALLLLGAVVTVLLAAAPYLGFIALAVAVVLLRGASFTQQAAWRRRTSRGRHWSDGPRTVVGYPWHVLRATVGSAFLLGAAAVLGATTWAGGQLLGFPDREVLLAAGAVVVATAWWGPASQRVRLPVGQAVTSVVRNPLGGWAVVALLLALAVAGWAAGQDAVTWAPATGAPWSSVGELLPPELRPRL